MRKAAAMENYKITIFSDNLNTIVLLLARLKNSVVDINVREFGTNITRQPLVDLNENPPELVLIDNENPEHSLLLNKLIKEEGTIREVPVVFYGGTDENAKLEALGSGVLDVLENPNTSECYLKLMNYIELGNKLAGTRNIDILTGLHSRKAGEKLLEETIFTAREAKKDLAVAMLDIDNMKQINEAAGKRKGDELLRKFAALMRHEIGVEGKNFAFRYSGKRFVLVVVNQETSKVLKTVLSLQDSYKELTKELGIDAGFSAGIAALNNESDNMADILNNAMESQNAAKREGRGRAYIYNSPVSDAKQKNLLIIGEDETLRSILTRRYNNLGFNVFQTAEREEASVLLEEKQIDAVISDFEPYMQLSDYFGKDNISQRGRRIIVLISSRIESTLEKVFNNGADDYIQKPFSIVELDLKLNKLLGR